jgi:hypothetical protein
MMATPGGSEFLINVRSECNNTPSKVGSVAVLCDAYPAWLIFH